MEGGLGVEVELSGNNNVFDSYLERTMVPRNRASRSEVPII